MKKRIGNIAIIAAIALFTPLMVANAQNLHNDDTSKIEHVSESITNISVNNNSPLLAFSNLESQLHYTANTIKYSPLLVNGIETDNTNNQPKSCSSMSDNPNPHYEQLWAIMPESGRPICAGTCAIWYCCKIIIVPVQY